jgi:hypothetical protein
MMELWRILTSDSQILGVQEFVYMFRKARATGLDMTLALLVHHHFEEAIEPEDIFPAQVAHLCGILFDCGVDVSEREAREKLAMFKDAYMRGDGDPVVADRPLALPHFRALLSLISGIMRVDMAYVISHLAWVTTGYFWMTDVLAAQVVSQCSQKGSEHGAICKVVPKSQKRNGATALGPNSVVPLFSWSAKAPDLAVLNASFRLNDFSRLIHVCGVLASGDEAGTHSRLSHSDNISTIFDGTLRNRQLLLQSKDVRLRGVTRSPSQRASVNLDATGFRGGSEIALLMEALFKSLPKAAGYSSPLQMCVGLLQRANPTTS